MSALNGMYAKTTGQPKDVNTDFDCKDFQFELYCQEEQYVQSV